MTPTPPGLDTAMKLVSEAFVPLGCVTGANPDGESFGFSVVDGDGDTLLSVAQVSPEDYADDTRLAAVIGQARRDLEERGCRLEPWSPALRDDTGIPETTPNY
ncbi:hypothetical protein [Stutzerimonas azotifigens]|uniref:hypothetical protein n=1 Tax=Stutzerimonas azotifigens TaxID=291995 RepID=UPI000489E5D4|nr:hypothetical protein [Stutzerimonas azotifigens]